MALTPGAPFILRFGEKMCFRHFRVRSNQFGSSKVRHRRRISREIAQSQEQFCAAGRAEIDGDPLAASRRLGYKSTFPAMISKLVFWKMGSTM
jgi:hypothetical protein